MASSFSKNNLFFKFQSPPRKLMFCLLLLFVFALNGISQQRAIYNIFLKETVPANGISVDFNAPILRWPYTKGKQVKYDVQLSMDERFPDAASIAATGLKGAIFNPHQALKTGKWYWKYKESGKNWSTVQNFVVTAKALPMVSPNATQFLAKIADAHPRILLDDPARDITNLSTKADALVIIADADKALTGRLLTEVDAQHAPKGSNQRQDNKILADAVVALGNKVNLMIEPLCQAYLLTRSEKYFSKATEIAMEVACWDPEGISGSRDFTDGICMYDMALVFDTFYDKLNTEQKGILLRAITKRAGKFYNSWVNNIESKVLSGHVWQLLLNDFFKTSLALYHLQPEAANWLSYAYELFLARAPVLGGIDGGWAEGASYFTMNMDVLTDIPEKIKYYTGFDFIQHHPWYQKNADWLIYNVPPGSSPDGYGDNTEELFEPPASYAAYAEVMAKLTQNKKYSWYAAKMRQLQKIDLSHEPQMRWFRLTQAENATAPEAGTFDLPMAQLNKEVGVASLHTDPANMSKDVMISMRSSPFGAYGHILSDQNTFNILYAGKRLFFRTGYKVAMDDPHRLGWSKHTKGQNGVLINGQGEPYSVEAFGNFSRFLQGDQLAYMKGDASNAYQSKETNENYGVNKFYRHIVLLKPNIIVIYDELESVALANWSWLIHSLKDMKLDAAHNTFTSTIDNAKGIGKLWSSQPFNWQITDKFDVPAVIFRNYKGMKTKTYSDQWHLKATIKTNTSKVRFLSVIQVSADGKILPFKEEAMEHGYSKLTIGDWQIDATLSYDLPPQLVISSTKRNTAFSAYGNEIKFKDQILKGAEENSSKLVEGIGGIINFKEVTDESVRPIR